MVAFSSSFLAMWLRTCAYMPDGSTFNGKQNVLPTPYYEALAVGDTLDDDWINPLIYHRDPRRELSKARIPSADGEDLNLAGSDVA